MFEKKYTQQKNLRKKTNVSLIVILSALGIILCLGLFVRERVIKPYTQRIKENYGISDFSAIEIYEVTATPTDDKYKNIDLVKGNKLDETKREEFIKDFEMINASHLRDPDPDALFSCRLTTAACSTPAARIEISEGIICAYAIENGDDTLWLVFFPRGVLERLNSGICHVNTLQQARYENNKITYEDYAEFVSKWGEYLPW